MPIHVITGGQAGSEAKGHATWRVMHDIRHADPNAQVVNIRTGGPNAGHTVYDRKNRKYPLRTIPVGGAMDDEMVVVAIAPGSEIDLAVLGAELNTFAENGIRLTLAISSEATLIDKKHKQAETSGDLVGRTGSTGKGIGAARADRVWRTAKVLRQEPEMVAYLERDSYHHVAVLDADEWDEFIDGHLDGGSHLVLEGTQGFVLGTHQGYYPQVTTSDCTAVDFLSAARISPWHRAVNTPYDLRVYVVVREFPIRVAGNSGPLPGETTWTELGLPEEKTTVTQKVRRVAKWNPDWVRRAVRANGGAPTVRLVLTMVDQRFPDLANLTGNMVDLVEKVGLSHPIWTHLDRIEAEAGAKIQFFTTGPDHAVWL